MTDIDQKRAYVADMYPGPRWKKKVEHMSDGQVLAIYMREHEHPAKKKPKPDEEPPKESTDDAEIPF